MDVYYVGGTNYPHGGASVATAVWIPPSAVSLPNTTEGWYKLTAAEDASAMYFGTLGAFGSISVYVSNVGSSPTDISDLTLYATGGFVELHPVTAGTTYLIKLPASSGMALFISGYGAQSAWLQPADKVLQLNLPNDVNLLGQTVPGYTPTTGLGAARKSGIKGPTFSGTYTLNRSFANDNYPGGTQDAIDCCWAHARVGSYSDFTFWSDDGTAETQGGACFYLSDPSQSGGNFVDWPIGSRFQNSGVDPAGHQTISFDVYAKCQRGNLLQIVNSIPNPVGGGPEDTPPPEYTSVVHESNFFDPPTLVKFEVMPTETNVATATDTPTDPQWYFRLVASDDPTRTDGTWGPKYPEFPPGGDSSYSWRGNSPSNGPETDLVPYQDELLVGGEWNDLTSYAATAMAYEATADVDDVDYQAGGALQFTGLPTEQLTWTGGAPGWALTKDPSDPEILYSTIRTYQVIVFRLTVRPGRVRYISAPEFPEYTTTTTTDGSPYTISGDIGPKRTRFSE